MDVQSYSNPVTINVTEEETTEEEEEEEETERTQYIWSPWPLPKRLHIRKAPPYYWEQERFEDCNRIVIGLY